MKKISFVLFAMLAALASCEADIDLPKKIEFPAEGGVIHLRSDYPLDCFELSDYDGNGEYFKRDTYPPLSDDLPLSYDTLSYQWLTFVNPRDDLRSYYFIAEPNHSGKARKLNFTGMMMSEVFSRKIVQKK